MLRRVWEKTVEPLAANYGLERIVVEHTDRIPYSETLRCLLDANALFAPGSDDTGYTASKIYPYLLMGKPMLSVFHRMSSVAALIKNVGGSSLVELIPTRQLQRLEAGFVRLGSRRGGFESMWT